jgi:YggT family protein
MGAIIDFSFFLVVAILTAIVWVIFAYVIATWLVAFNVINMRNRIVYAIVHFLETVARPILRPVQRLIPPIGGTIDLSPLILLVVIQGALIYLLPPLQTWLHGLVGS